MTLLLCSFALVIGCATGWTAASIKFRDRERAAELRGIRSRGIAHSPDEAFRHFEGAL